MTSNPANDVDLERAAGSSNASTASTAWNHELRWNNISYEIRQGKDLPNRMILKDLSGGVRSGEMVAIMGSSGAGKTTLLNCLSGRLSTGFLSGQILYNGYTRDARTWRKTMAFVEQDDVLYSNLTVRETLRYSARLRLSSDEYTTEEKDRQAEDILKRLRLSKAANTPIGGGEVRGVSGGERKRTAIGQELVGNPEILFLDEPTSGLDSNSAHAVMENVKNDAIATGRIVIATIHQPSFDLLCLFDTIILLSGGSIVYSGSPLRVVEYFESLGYPLSRPGMNPADHFMDLMTIDSSKSDEEMKKDVERIEFLQKAHLSKRDKASLQLAASDVSNLTKNLDAYATVEEELEKDAKVAREAAQHPSPEVRAKAPSTTPLKWANSWFAELAILLDRSWRQLIRGKAVLIAFTIRTIILILLIGFTFFRIKSDQKSIQNRIGILFFWPVNQVFNTIMPIVGVFPIERVIMLRERATRSYRVFSFYLAKVLVEIVPNTFFTILACVPLYYMMGLRDGIAPMLRFVFIQWVEVMVCIAVGFLIGAAVPSLQLAQVVGPLIGVIFLLYGGSLINNDDLPYFFRGFQYISPVNCEYLLSIFVLPQIALEHSPNDSSASLLQPSDAYRANMFNELQGLKLSCSSNPAEPCFRDGDQVLQVYSLTAYSLWGCVAIMGALFAGYLAVGYSVLRIAGKPKTKLV
ncbi:ATP-binding cassette sub- G member 2 [Phlyctochytrium bullatum]|nr:ATP-binding cassette sub- G member 2 [Phlyctochytrium bullatum]